VGATALPSELSDLIKFSASSGGSPEIEEAAICSRSLAGMAANSGRRQRRKPSKLSDDNRGIPFASWNPWKRPRMLVAVFFFFCPLALIEIPTSLD
jgi:hypothetical protein